MITKEQAIEIAKKQHDKEFEFYTITEYIPDNCHIWEKPLWDPCGVWCILCCIGTCKGICSSHAIVVCKYTGEILYDGSAYDEG